MTAPASYAEFYRRSIDQRDEFWAEQARPDRMADAVCIRSATSAIRRSRAGSSGGTTNLCHNAVDRHLATRAWQPPGADLGLDRDRARNASTALPSCRPRWSAWRPSCRPRACSSGDRVLVYMPMIPGGRVFAMLACARIGAIHSVVFGGFASVSLAQPHRGCRRRSSIDQCRCRQPLGQGRALQASAGRGDHACRRTRCRQGPDGQPGPRADDEPQSKAAIVDYAAAARAAISNCPRAGAPGSTVQRDQLHALHQRHHRPAQGRAARRGRLRGGAGCEHEAHLPAARRARPISPPATSAGSWATATSSTALC